MLHVSQLARASSSCVKHLGRYVEGVLGDGTNNSLLPVTVLGIN